MPRKAPRQARSRQMRDDILEAAARVFDRDGHAATTNRIAEVAGVSIGSLYQYFPNKEALLTALHEKHVAEVGALLRASLERHAGESLRPLVQGLAAALVAAHRLRPGLQHLLHRGLPQLARPAPESPAKQALAESIHSHLEARRNELAPSDPAVAAHTAIRMAESLVHAAVLDAPEGVDANALAHAAGRALCAYLLRQEGAA